MDELETNLSTISAASTVIGTATNSNLSYINQLRNLSVSFSDATLRQEIDTLSTTYDSIVTLATELNSIDPAETDPAYYLELSNTLNRYIERATEETGAVLGAIESSPASPQTDVLIDSVGNLATNYLPELEYTNSVLSRSANTVQDIALSQAGQIAQEAAPNYLETDRDARKEAPPEKDPTKDPPAEGWGVRFRSIYTPTVSQVNPGNLSGAQGPTFLGPPAPIAQDFYFYLLPAMASALPVQGGRDVPNSTPGLQFKVVPNIAKMKVPGFQPVFQNLGMDSLMVTMVGAFSGSDGRNYTPERPQTALDTGDAFYRLDDYGDRNSNGSIGTQLIAISQKLDAYKNFQEFYQFVVLEGREVEVEINVARNKDYLLRQDTRETNMRGANGNPKFKALVRNMEVHHVRSDRTYYAMQLEVTDFGLASETPINLGNDLQARIDEYQASQERELAEADAEEFRQIQEMLANSEGQYEQFATEDGCIVYEFNGDGYNGEGLKACVVDGVTDYENLTPDQVREAKNNRIGETTAGSLISLAGSAVGCGLGLVTTATGAVATATGVGAVPGAGALAVGTALSVLSCGFFINEAANLGTGNTGIVEGTTSAVFSVFGGRILGRGLNLVRRGGGAITRSTGQLSRATTQQLNQRVPAAANFFRNNGWLRSGVQRVNRLGTNTPTPTRPLATNVPEGQPFLTNGTAGANRPLIPASGNSTVSVDARPATSSTLEELVP